MGLHYYYYYYYLLSPLLCIFTIIYFKLQQYNTLIRPTVTYASETRVLNESMINKLMIFERKIMRKILGPTRSDDVEN